MIEELTLKYWTEPMSHMPRWVFYLYGLIGTMIGLALGLLAGRN